jgi:hypothetical protein
MKKRRFKTVYTHPSGVLFMAALTILLIANLCGCAGPEYEFDPVEETQWALIVEQTISAQMATAEANMTSTAAQAIIETKNARATAAALATSTNTPTITLASKPIQTVTNISRYIERKGMPLKPFSVLTENPILLI